MSRIPTPATIEAAPAACQPLLQAVKKQLMAATTACRRTPIWVETSPSSTTPKSPQTVTAHRTM